MSEVTLLLHQAGLPASRAGPKWSRTKSLSSWPETAHGMLEEERLENWDRRARDQRRKHLPTCMKILTLDLTRGSTTQDDECNAPDSQNTRVLRPT